MITLTKSGNAIVFTFDDNDHYLNDGKIEVPVNSLTLVTDESQMATFRKSASNDIFISATYDELGMSKSDLESWFKENMVGSTGGGGVTSGEVQSMIDESISGLAESSAVTEEISEAVSGKADTSAVTQSINAAVSGKADTSDVQEIASNVATVSGDVNTLSGSVESNHNAITALNGDVSTLSGKVNTDETILTGHTANTDIHVTASDKQNWNNKSDFSGSYNDLTDKPTIPVVPTNVSDFVNDAGYATSGYVDSAVSGKMDTDSFDSFYNSDYVYYKQETNEAIEGLNSAVSGKMDTSAFNTYSASTDARLSEDEEVTSAALNELNEALDDKADTTAVTASIAAAVSGKQDTLIAGTNITISGNVISAEGGGGKAISGGTNISITTGETADTINCTLPISVSSNNRIKISNHNNNVYNNDSIIVGGSYNEANADHTHVGGRYNSATNEFETAFGNANISNKANTTYGNSGNTLLSVGNGVNYYIHHNAFEIRQNGDIYIADTNDTTYQNYYEKPMIKLQDSLGGGGLPESAFTAYTAATDARLAEDEEVTAAGLNALNDAIDDKADASDLGGLKLVQISQSDYDALTTKDSSILYIITSSN